LRFEEVKGFAGFALTFGDCNASLSHKSCQPGFGDAKSGDNGDDRGLGSFRLAWLSRPEGGWKLLKPIARATRLTIQESYAQVGPRPHMENLHAVSWSAAELPEQAACITYGQRKRSTELAL
jgi:hypothetical protein